MDVFIKWIKSYPDIRFLKGVVFCLENVPWNSNYNVVLQAIGCSTSSD